MKKLLVFLCAMSLVFGVVGVASATIWTDTHYPDPLPLYMAAGGANQTYDFTLDIKNDGFDPGFWGFGADDVLWYTVDLYVTDDLTPWYDFKDTFDWGDNSGEVLTVTTPVLWFDLFEESYEVDFFGGPLSYPMNLAGFLRINFNGTLGIDLTATEGDFYFWAGKVTASDTNPVPEPATMLLLGSGLIGLAVFGRKKLFKK